MNRILTTLFFCFILLQTFGQSNTKVSTYLLTQYNKTLYDWTSLNNPSSIGLGLQTIINNKTKFKPTIEFTADLYLENYKVLISNPDGTTPTTGNDVRGMINLFVGPSYYPNAKIYFSILAGPSFIHEKTLPGIKPTFGFYFSKSQKLTGKISYINIFNRIGQYDFGSASFALGLKLF